VCGIAGIHAYDPRAESVDRAELDALRDAMRTRGPDGFGSFVDERARVGLAHRRLSIIDLSPGGAQPMANSARETVIVFNGEIYNHRALRAELEAEGRHFRSSSDTEVLLALYERDGERMFERLRGMYAFAIWDARRGALLLARDPHGIKPLYLADDGRTLRFASQVKALLAGRVSPERCLGGTAGFYVFGSVPEPLTFHRAIRALEAGSFAWFDERGPQPVTRHFRVASHHLAHDAPETRPDALPARVAEALADSVRHHLVADVPVGAFLSAGVDSTALVGLMRDAGARAIQTLTLGFEALRGTPADEVPLAEAMARRYGTTHTTVHLGASDLLAARDAYLASMDQPSIDGLNSWLVCRAAHDAGLKVALSGLGADELFGGYSSFRTIPRAVSWLGPLAGFAALGRVVERALDAIGPHRFGLSPKHASVLAYGGTFAGAYLLQRGLFMPHELPMLMGREQAEEGLATLRPLERIDAALQPTPGSPFACVSVLESSLYMRNQLLRDADWTSMAHGLEVRVPFVDATLTRTLGPAFAAPGLAVQGKAWTAAAPRLPVPRALVTRKKTGFFVPIEPLLDAPGLDLWRRVPALARPGCHWARRLAHALVARERP